MSTKRLFIAVPLPEPVANELQALISALRKATPAVRWVRPEQMHVTLRFLGDVEDDRDGSLLEALRAVRAAPFRMNLAEVGAFPDRRKPRVVWTGIATGREPMRSLAGCVEERLAQAGFAREDRPFSPHVTLGRVKKSGGFRVFWQRVDATPFVGKEIVVGDVRLIHSRLTSQGPVYTDLESFPLRGEQTQS